MAETTDQTHGFTVSLTYPPTCDGPTTNFPTGCNLLKAYDTNNDGLISASEKGAAMTDYNSGVITWDEYQFVLGAHILGSINTKCPGCYTSSTPAKGELVDYNYPTSARNGEVIDIQFKVRNTGGAAGVFRVYLYEGVVRKGETNVFSTAAGATSNELTIDTMTPASGTSVTYKLLLSRLI